MRAPSWPATSAMSARSASSVMPVSAARPASAVHGARADPAGALQRGVDALEGPPGADLGRGLQRLGRPGAGAALQRHQVEVAAQRVPEVVALLGRVDVGHQVGGEEQDDPADQRGADRDRPVRRRAAQGQQRRQQHRGGQAEQAAGHLAGQPGGPVLAQQGQVGGGHRQPGQRIGQPPAQPLGRRRPAACQADRWSDSFSRSSAASSRGARRDQLGQRDEHARPASAPTTTAQVLTTASLIPRRPRVPRRPAGRRRAAAGGPARSSRNRPGAGIVPSRCSQASPAA